MMRFDRRLRIRTTWLAGVTMLLLTINLSQANAQSSSFSYYNPRTGMQYSQGYSFQGRSFSNYFYYGPRPGYSSGHGYGYSSGYGTRGRPSYVPRNHSRPNYGYQSGHSHRR